MAQLHGDRLTAVDASFLAQERANSHMHVGAVLIFEGPPPSYDDFLNSVRSRLHLVPRYRQRLTFPPLETGRALWIDDATFNLEYHVRHTALPSPGSEDQLRFLAARIHSQRLDRAKPLWETWLVQGLAGNRFALISKTHHALVDGVAGVDLATVLFDLEPVPKPVPHEGEPWVPQPEPTNAELMARGLKSLLKAPLKMAAEAAQAAANPSRTVEVAKEAAEGLGEVVWAGMNPAPPCPLNVEIGPHRRLAFVRNDLADFKAIKNTFGGTVNDVVLTVVSGALERWLKSRGVRTEGLELRALVPVSIRAQGEQGTLGNRIAVMRGPLPVYIEDPVVRLRFVKRAMDGLKDSKQAIGAEVLSNVQNLAPPTVLAQASRLNFSTRLFNLIVTNVPGPQFPLYVLGRELQDLLPIAFLPENHALAVAIMSYDGGIDFGLLGDYDAMPDLDDFARYCGESLQELLKAAKAEQRKTAKASGKAPTAKGSGAAPKRKRASKV